MHNRLLGERPLENLTGFYIYSVNKYSILLFWDEDEICDVLTPEEGPPQKQYTLTYAKLNEGIANKEMICFWNYNCLSIV